MIPGKQIFLAAIVVFLYSARLPGQCYPNIKALGGACLGDTVAYAAETYVGYNYVWKVTGGTIVSGTNNDTVLVYWPQTGAVTVKVTLSKQGPGCGSSQIYNEFVNEVLLNPVAGPDPALVCAGSDPVLYTNCYQSPSGGGEHTPFWSVIGGTLGPAGVDSSKFPFISDSVAVTWNIAGTSKIIYMLTHDLSGCTASDTMTINKSGTPVPDFCWVAIGNFFIFQNESNYNGTAVYNWDFGDGSVSPQESPGHFYPIMNIYSVCLTVTDTCGSDSLCKPVKVPCVSSTTGFSYSKSGLTVNFTDTSYSGSSWFWDFGDGASSTLQNPTHAYLSGNTYKVCLTMMDSCGCQEVCNTVAVSCTAPVAGFKTSVSGTQVIFTDSSSGGGYHGWDFGDGTFSSDFEPVHNFPMTGVYAVCQYTFNGCGADSVCHALNVSCPVPLSGFQDSIDSLTVYFTDTSVNGSNILWDFGDGTSDTIQNPVHIYAPGFFSVCLSTYSLCFTDSVCKQIQIGCPAPVAGFEAVPSLYDLFLNDTSLHNPFEWYWEFGDGGIDSVSTPYHTYASVGTYQVCLRVINICDTDSVCKAVAITCPLPGISYSQNANQLLFSFSDSSTNFPTSWLWSFGDGDTSSATEPTHAYAVPGNYLLCLKVTNFCGTDSTCDTIAVICPYPVPNFSASTNNLLATFTDSSSGVSSRLWDFGDGTTSALQNPAHTYATYSTYTVCLYVTNNCGSDTLCQQIVLTCGALVAGFSFATSSTVASFTDTSLSAQSWLWDFGDGNTSVSKSPVHIYSAYNTYTVCLVVYNICSADTICQQVIISCSQIQAGFYFSDSLKTVIFTDSSFGGISWVWDFGDGTTDSIANPTHVYSAFGSYLVCLIANSSCTSDTLCQLLTVSCPAVQPGFSFSTSLNTAVFTDSSSGATSWLWDFGDGNNSTGQNPVHTYASPGNYIVCQSSMSNCDTSVTCQNVEVVCPVPVAGFTYSIIGNTITFTDTSSSNFPKNWHWDFGDGDTSNLQHPSHTFATGFSFEVCLSITDSCGTSSFCDTILLLETAKEMEDPVRVYPNPSQDALRFEWTPAWQADGLMIVDVTGRLIFDVKIFPERGGYSYSVRSLANGFYYARMKFGSVQISKPFWVCH